MERTFTIIKPDAVQRGLAGEILSRYERRGLKIVAMKMIHMSQDQAVKLYEMHKKKPFFEALVKFMLSGPVIVVVMDGPNALVAARNTNGATNPSEAAPGSIRGDLGLDRNNNLVHASDSSTSAGREIRIFFHDEEILSWERSIDHWIFE